MKKLLPFLLLLPLALLQGDLAKTQGVAISGLAKLQGTAPAAGASYILNEDCEGTGTPAGWAGNGDWDSTGVTILGSECWFTTVPEEEIYTISDADNYTAIVVIQMPDATPGSTLTLFGFRTSALGAVCIARLNTDGTLSVYADGSDITSTVNSLSDATNAYIKLVWVDGGTCSIEFNSTLSFSGSGNGYTSKTGGTTADCTRFILGSTSTGTDMYADNIQLSASDIP